MFTRRQILPDGLAGSCAVGGAFGAPQDGFVRAVYTRQEAGEWKYCVGQCALGSGADEDTAEAYRNFVFVSKRVRQVTLQSIIESLSGSGIEIHNALPPIRLAASHPNWNEEIIPSHESRSRSARRRFTASIESQAFFIEDQLIDYALPYRASAAGYAKTFLALKPSDSIDGRRGEFSIEVPDTRGSIRFAGGLISIRDPAVPLRLVGMINGEIPVDVRNDTTAEYDENTVREVELWLMTSDNDVVDYRSSTSWPYKYQVPQQEADRERRLAETIGRGEGETCEFKPHIDLGSPKATELERTVCAFSNQRGGILFFGVDDEGDVVGLARDLSKRGGDVSAALDDYQNEVNTRLRESLKCNQCFTSSIVKVSGTYLIAIEVVQAPEVNYIIRGELGQLAYIRHGATSARMSPPEIMARHGGNGIEATLRFGAFSE